MTVDVSALLTLPNMLTFMAEGGAALIVLWMLDQPWPWVELMPSEYKRYAAYVLAFGLAVLFYVFRMALLSEPMPVGWQAWFNLIWAVGAPASLANQLLHARFSLGKMPVTRHLKIDYKVE